MKASKRHQNTLMIMLMALFCMYSCQSSNKEKNLAETSGRTKPGLSEKSEIPDSAPLENGIQVAMFIEQTGLGSMLEMGMAKLAVDRAQHAGIRDFGKRMIQDYSRLNLELSALALIKGLRLPAGLGQKQQRQIREMSTMEDDYFEKLYLKIVIEESNKYIELFNGALGSGDGGLYDFSQKFLPVLKSQRQRAAQLLSTLK